MRLSIRAKVFVAVSLSLVVIFGLTVFLVATDTTHRLKSSLNEESKSFASLSTTSIGNTFILYQSSGTIKINEQVNNYLRLDTDVTAVRVVATDGAVLFNSQKTGGQAVSAQDAATFEPVFKYSNSGYIRQIVEPLVEASGVHRYAIVYDVSSQRVEQNVTAVERLILYLGIAFLIVGAIGTWLFLNVLLLRPLRSLSQSANVISAGKYDQPITPHGNDEIGDLARSVGRMAESLKADIVKLKDLDKLKSEFMMIASHNLRTPLTAMRGYIELADSADTVPELKKILGSVGQNVSRLHLLAEDVLTIATLEAGSVMPLTPMPLKSFLDSIGEEFIPLAREKDLHWQFINSVPADARMELAQANMRSALSGLIDNAIKFTDAGGDVTVNALVEAGRLHFTVTDSGIGIAPEEVPKLFTKFHRGTDTMRYDYEGVGIGLYLSKLIISQHGGDINLQSKQHQGTICLVTVPLSHSVEKTSPAKLS